MMNGVTGIPAYVITVEQACMRKDYAPLEICLEVILQNGEKGEIVCNPIAAARIKNLLIHHEFVHGMPATAKKVVDLLDRGPLGKCPKLIEEALDQPEHVQKAVSLWAKAPHDDNLILEDYTPAQLFDILRFSLKFQNDTLFDCAARKMFSCGMIKRDGDGVVIDPRLMPAYLENSERGRFLRESCHGVIAGWKCPERELLQRYLPHDTYSSQMTTLWVGLDGLAQLRENLNGVQAFHGSIYRLVISCVEIPYHIQELHDLFSSLPYLSEVVFDRTSWEAGGKTIPLSFYENLKGCKISLRNVEINDAKVRQSLEKVIKFYEESDDSDRVKSEPKRGFTPPVEKRDREMGLNSLAYFGPEIADELIHDDTWIFDFILENLDTNIWVETTQLPWLLSWILKHAETKFVEGNITLETIGKLVNHLRFSARDEFWPLEGAYPHNTLVSNILACVPLPTLPLMYETKSPNPLQKFKHGEGYQILVPTASLDALRYWLLKPCEPIDLSGEALLQLDALAAELGLETKIRERYTSTAFRGLNAKQSQWLLKRIPEKLQLELLLKAFKYKTYRPYLFPQDWLEIQKDPSPYGAILRNKVKGLAVGCGNVEKLIELVASPEALANVKTIFMPYSDETLHLLATLTRSCKSLEKVVLAWHISRECKNLRELSSLSGNFTLILESATIQMDKEEDRWTDLGIDKNIRVQFRHMRGARNGETFLLDAYSHYLDGSDVELISDYD